MPLQPEDEIAEAAARRVSKALGPALLEAAVTIAVLEGELERRDALASDVSIEELTTFRNDVLDELGFGEDPDDPEHDPATFPDEAVLDYIADLKRGHERLCEFRDAITKALYGDTKWRNPRDLASEVALRMAAYNALREGIKDQLGVGIDDSDEELIALARAHVEGRATLLGFRDSAFDAIGFSGSHEAALTEIRRLANADQLIRADLAEALGCKPGATTKQLIAKAKRLRRDAEKYRALGKPY